MEQSSIAALTKAFAWKICQIYRSKTIRATDLLYRTNSNIKVMPCRPDLASAEKADHPDRVLVGSSCPSLGIVMLNLTKGFPGYAFDDVAKPPYFLLNQSNIR